APPNPIFALSVPAHLADAGLIRVSPGGRGRNMFSRIGAILFGGSWASPAQTRATFCSCKKSPKTRLGGGHFRLCPPPKNLLPQRHKGGRMPPFGYPLGIVRHCGYFSFVSSWQSSFLVHRQYCR